MPAAADAVEGTPDQDAAARGALYTLLARAFDHPDEQLHAAAADGELTAEARTLLDRTALEVDVADLTTTDDYDALCARYNHLFSVGFARDVDRANGDRSDEGPPVPLYESNYRSAAWRDVNLDLARAYDYYGLSVDQDERDHHDNLRLELEFAGYLARREAAVDGPDAAAARRDFLDRHLVVAAEGVAEQLADHDDAGLYEPLGSLLVRIVTADRDALAARADLPEGGGES